LDINTYETGISIIILKEVFSYRIYLIKTTHEIEVLKNPNSRTISYLNNNSSSFEQKEPERSKQLRSYLIWKILICYKKKILMK